MMDPNRSMLSSLTTRYVPNCNKNCVISYVISIAPKYYSKFWERKMKIKSRWNWVVGSVWVWISTAWSTCEGGRLCWCLPRGGGFWQTTFTSSVSVVLGKSRCHVTWFSSTCIFFFLSKSTCNYWPCKNKIKRNYVIYQTLQNYGSKKEKWKPYGTLMNFFQKIHSFFLLKKKKKKSNIFSRKIRSTLLSAWSLTMHPCSVK